MTTDPPFSIALLGCGAVVQDFYLPVLKSLAGELDVNLCCDIDAKNAERVAGELGATAVTGGLDQLLESPPTCDVVHTRLPWRSKSPGIVPPSTSRQPWRGPEHGCGLPTSCHARD